MKNTSAKKALQWYKKNQGNYMTGPSAPLKKEADLASFYYPGIDAVLEKIAEKPALQEKMDRLHRTVLVIGSRSPERFPLVSAKAALLSLAAEANALPLQLTYKNPKNFGLLLQSLENTASAHFLAEVTPTERKVLQATYKGKVPLLFHEQMEAAAVVAAVKNAAKYLKKSAKKIAIALEGDDMLAADILQLLIEEECTAITLLDDRGPIYNKRPNINKQKKELLKMLKSSKDERSREEVLADSQIYISTLSEDISGSVTNLLPEKAVIIGLKSHKIDKQAKQSVVSTLPNMANHISDLHIAAGILMALSEGKKWSSKTLSQAISGLQSVYKAPKSDRIVPGLLEKNLAKKIAKAIS